LRQTIEWLTHFYNEFKDRVDFLFVYISEAHACDEWPLGDHVVTKKHVTIQDRIKAAQEFLTKTNFPFPTYCDNIDDKFNELYAAWPERYYILQRGFVSLVGMPTERGYDRNEMKVALESHLVTEREREVMIAQECEDADAQKQAHH